MTLCLITQRIHEVGHARLRAAGIEILAAPSGDDATVRGLVGAADAVITRNNGLSAAAIAAAPRLRVIGVHGVGTDAVAVDEATRRGIVVVNTPGRNDRSVAEQALGLTFALAKATVHGDAAVRRGDGAFRDRVPLHELAGRTFGVVGFGTIGRLTARLARALGMRVVVWSRRLDPAAVAEEGVEGRPTLAALLAESDVVSLHLALTPETRGLIGAAELALMQPHALLVNTARGALVDEAALAAALSSGVIGGAGLDVFAVEPLPLSSPLLGAPNLVLAPHLAGSTIEALERTAIAVAEQVVAVLEGRRPDHVVNPAAYGIEGR